MTRRLGLPVVLLVVGTLLLAGCFWVPLPEKPVSKGRPNVPKMVGGEKSQRPVRVGMTREQVEAVLGSPMRWRTDGSAAAYGVVVRNGAWVYPLCFMGTATWKDYVVRLDYGPGGRLEGYKVVSGDGGGESWLGEMDPGYGLWQLVDEVLPREGTESVGRGWRVTTRRAATTTRAGVP